MSDANHESHQAMLDKIRALLAKAEATPFPEEAKSFTAKAQELMAKWAIDDAMLKAASGQDFSPGDVRQAEVMIDANEYRGPKINLLYGLALINDCQGIMGHQRYVEVDGKRVRKTSLTLVGHVTDLEFVQAVYSSLLLQSAMELISPMVMIKMQAECPEGGHRIRWRNSFMMAYGNEVIARCKSIKELAKRNAQQEHGQTMALVLVRRSDLVKRKFDELFPKRCKTSGSSAGRGLGSAAEAGAEAGRRADIGRPKVGGKTGAVGQLNN